MLEYLKKPMFYFIAVPVLMILSAAYSGLYALPDVQQQLVDTLEQSRNVDEYAEKILEIAPSRAMTASQNTGDGKFDYATVIQQFAALWNIPPSKYDLMVNPQTKLRGKKVQSATLIIEDVSIQTLARFYSSLTRQWPDLSCEQIKISKAQGGKDNWRVSPMKLKYIY